MTVPAQAGSMDILTWKMGPGPSLTTTGTTNQQYLQKLYPYFINVCFLTD